VKDFRIPFRSVWNNPGNRGRRAAKLLDAIGWQLAKRARGQPRTIRLRSGALFKAYPDCVVSSALIYADWPEFHELMFIRRALEPSDAAIDIGANVGHILLSISDIIPPARLFAFEPTPVSFARLKENWLLNNWPTEHLYSMGIGESETSGYVRNTSVPNTTNSLYTEAAAGRVPVRIVSLDSLASLWRGLPVGLLKIDVEGFEVAVFRGATQFLETCRPKLVMFESLKGELEPGIGETLRAADYAVFQLNHNGEPQLGRVDAQNLFATPTSRLEALCPQT
jgi:FkbM family methyltransferase